VNKLSIEAQFLTQCA